MVVRRVVVAMGISLTAVSGGVTRRGAAFRQDRHWLRRMVVIGHTPCAFLHAWRGLLSTAEWLWSARRVGVNLDCGLASCERRGAGMTTGWRDPVAIRTVGLRKSFGAHTAVAGLDLSVGTGELFALLGPNGAGKTTTIKMLCCLLRPTGGTATILGHDIATDALAVKQVIGVSPQETAVAPNLNAWENLALMAGLHGIDRQGAHRRAGELLEVTGLVGRATDKAKHYSGGMQRRLSIAMALVSEPEVVFLDEPTIGLDPQARRGMWEYIAGLKGATTVVLTTHYLEEADALADRIAVIDGGELVALGTPDELKAGIAGTPVMMVEAPDVGAEAMAALQQVYPTARTVAGGVEIEADDVSVYEIGDCLRPFGVEIKSTAMRHVSLDDVFLELTGKELRE
jgi:ABC-2 type transport system ATP-binding protein